MAINSWLIVSLYESLMHKHNDFPILKFQFLFITHMISFLSFLSDQ